ncbi:putative pentatricopeptide [Rosa chinensis]|uniref:Putative pentatricopeptide n=1 Tax=Rosa chinensis TaxID=74649 RepID=A0A2P6R7Q4_ROSCH|nr:putative pentatricopeptide [Rosa chinensis]
MVKVNSPHRGDPENLPEVFSKVIISNRRFLQILIKMFYNLLSEGYKDLAMELIDKATEEGDAPKVVVMTSVLEEYTEAGKATEALHLYQKMLDSEDCVPNAYTYNVLIKALAADPDPNFLGVAKECVMEMMGKKMQPSASTYMAVFEAYAGHEKTEEAKQFLEEMKINGFVADRKAMRAIRQLLNGKEHMLTSIMDILFGK